MARKLITVVSPPVPPQEVLSVTETAETIPGPAYDNGKDAPARIVAGRPWKAGAQAEDVYLDIPGALRITYDGGMQLLPGFGGDPLFWWNVATQVKQKRDAELAPPAPNNAEPGGPP